MVGKINLNIRSEVFPDEYYMNRQVVSSPNIISQDVKDDINNELFTDLTDEDYESNGEAELLIGAITQYVDGILLSFIVNESTNLLDKIGINKENLEVALQVINLGQSAVSKIESIIPFIPTNITMIPDAKETLTTITTSLKEMYMAMYINAEHIYHETINEMITNFPSWEEIQKDAINALLDVGLDLINNLCYLYTGFTLIELYYKCTSLITLYKQYKENRKLLREQEQQGIRLANASINDPKWDFGFNSRLYKEMLKNAIAESSDILYNSFMILTIRDTFLEVKQIIQLMHGIDLRVLVENINQVEDVINLLDDIGLNEDSWTVSLADAINLGINDFHNQVNAITKQMVALGISTAANIAGNTVDMINPLQVQEQLFNFEAETETDEKTGKSINILKLNIFMDPYLIKFENQLSKVLLNAVDDNNHRVVNSGLISKIISLARQGYDKQEDQEMYIGQYKLLIHFEIEGFESITIDENSSYDDILKYIELETAIAQLRNAANETYLNEDKRKDTVNEFFNTVSTEEYTQDPKRTKKRPTLKLLHDLLALINKFVPLFKVFATLVSNYKVNKAKAKAHSLGNIFAIIKVIAKVNNLLNIVNKTLLNFYTIRTLKLYDYINDNIKKIDSNTPTLNINVLLTTTLYDYLMNNNMNYRDINTKNNTVLYIDFDSLLKQREEMDDMTESIRQFFGDDASLFVSYPKTKYTDGTTIGIDKIETAGNIVYFSNSSLPLVGSQILRARNNGYDSEL